MRKLLLVGGLTSLVVAVGLLIYVATSSIRHGGTTVESLRIDQLATTRDVQGLNEILLNTPSLTAKLDVLYWLDKERDPSSIPYVIQMLSFDLPWYDLLDSELRPLPKEIRFAAHEVLANYPRDLVEPRLIRLSSSKKPYERLYAAGVLHKFGNPTGTQVLKDLEWNSQSSIREEASWVLRMAELRGKGLGQESG